MANFLAERRILGQIFCRQAVKRPAMVVFASDDRAFFAVLQSRVHELWARFFGSSLKDDLRYTPSDCFETYPFPADLSCVRSVGDEYLQERAQILEARQEGLTKIYNHFNNPSEHAPDIERLRELHARVDRAVLDAYGWTDIHPIYDFREQLDESIRLTWDDDTRDEVLARLLELNRVRAEEEAREAAGKPPEPKSPAKKAAKKKPKGDTGPLLPGMGD